jgi:hypothetical protein
VQGGSGAATSGAVVAQFWVQEVLGAAHVAWGLFEVNLVGLGSGQPTPSAQILNWWPISEKQIQSSRDTNRMISHD